MRGFLVDGGLWWLLVHSSPISNHHLITWEINLDGDCSNVPPAAAGACPSVFSIELFLLINNLFFLFVCLFLPSWAFHKPQTSFACIWKVHVGIVNSVVHHPNTQSVSFLLSAVLGMLMLAGYAHGYIAAQTHILLALFFQN
jgi:hypothetical protein